MSVPVKCGRTTGKLRQKLKHGYSDKRRTCDCDTCLAYCRGYAAGFASKTTDANLYVDDEFTAHALSINDECPQGHPYTYENTYLGPHGLGPKVCRRCKADKAAAKRTHCPFGHEYTRSNTYRTGKHKRRRCRTCKKDTIQRNKERHDNARNSINRSG